MSETRDAQESRELFRGIVEVMLQDVEKGTNEFYKTYGRLITSIAYRICRCRSLADEVVNDVLVAVWQNAHKLQKITAPEAWLYVVTSNFAKNALKRTYGSAYKVPLDENVVDSKDPFEEMIDMDTFYWMIGILSETEQKVMIYRFVSDYTFDKIGRMFHKSTSTVSSMYQRALVKIRKFLEKN